MHSFIPTPSHSAVAFGPFTIHFYALCILAGVVVALLVGRSRYGARGGDIQEITDVAIVAIPAGIIGGRLYHVLTSPDRYFGSNGKPLDAFKIWDGGLGIWGAIALGTLASYLVFNRGKRSLTFAVFADSLAPGLLFAQAIGRFGNWFNGELFGRPTHLPWGLSIPLPLRPAGYESFATFHPTFLYEAIWCAASALVLIWVGEKYPIANGNLFFLYIFIYCLGRSWIEALRIDEAHHLFGLRLNEWVSLLGIFFALLLFAMRQRSARKVVFDHD